MFPRLKPPFDKHQRDKRSGDIDDKILVLLSIGGFGGNAFQRVHRPENIALIGGHFYIDVAYDYSARQQRLPDGICSAGRKRDFERNLFKFVIFLYGSLSAERKRKIGAALTSNTY